MRNVKQHKKNVQISRENESTPRFVACKPKDTSVILNLFRKRSKRR